MTTRFVADTDPRELAAFVSPCLHDSVACSVVSCRRKMGKLIVQFTATFDGHSYGHKQFETRRYIGNFEPSGTNGPIA